MTMMKINSEVATALINYDLIMTPCTPRSSIHSQRTEKVYLNGAALSPLCEPGPGYDGRMTTNSSTSRPAAADARATTFDEWITTEAMINSGELLIMDDGSIMSWIDLDAASTRYAARLARVAAVLADCPDDSAL
jgi:hypothetical protein